MLVEEQISEMKGKVVSRRVLEVEGPTMETTVEADGTYKEIQVHEILTFVGSPLSGTVFHGEGKGIIMTTQGELAVYTGKGTGTIKTSGVTSWRGAVFFSTLSNGELKFLDKSIGVFEAEIDSQGNFSEKTWEWK
jgi:hypothetical protein